jgi:pyruvate dehydrogenase kinase 2/3/4
MLCCFLCQAFIIAGGGILNPDVQSPSDLFSFSHVRNATRLEDSRLGALRSVSSSSRGMMATVAEQLNTRPRQRAAPYHDSEPDTERTGGLGRHMRIGIGLPMSNIYAKYFGGSLEIVSLNGWGENGPVSDT